jgi:hypothetical protein
MAWSSQATPATPFRSKDGQWFLLYAVSGGQTGFPLFDMFYAAELGLATALLPSVAKGLVALLGDFDVLRGKVRGMAIGRELWRPLNRRLRDGFAEMNWDKVAVLLRKRELWHNRIAMPYQMHNYTLAQHALVAVADASGRSGSGGSGGSGDGYVAVQCPMSMTFAGDREEETLVPSVRGPPRVGEHDGDVLGYSAARL